MTMLDKIKVAVVALVIAGATSAAFARTTHYRTFQPELYNSGTTDEGGGRYNTEEPGGNAGS
jgi:hypothetical protein